MFIIDRDEFRCPSIPLCAGFRVLKQGQHKTTCRLRSSQTLSLTSRVERTTPNDDLDVPRVGHFEDALQLYCEPKD